MNAALATRGLDKSFGSLVVAKGIAFELPQGARYALIGPNGAGKTTLINLMTGMLRPDAGAIMLGAEDITALPPDKRVTRGLVRTFQINTLFPNLNALEAVTLAVCEREGVARTWWKRVASLSGGGGRGAWHPLLADARRGLLPRRRASFPTGASGCWRSRSRSPPRPKVLLLDEPAAGVPRDESAELFAVISQLSRDITVLFIEHDMNFVFRFASRIIVMVGGRILLEGTPDEVSADPRVREVYLGKSHGARHG